MNINQSDFFSSQFQVIGYSSNLTMFISNSTVGTYTCQVTVEGYPAIESSCAVYQEGPPVIVGHTYHSHGDSLEIVCEAVSSPPPTIVYNNYTTATTHTLDKDKVVSTLIIKDSVDTDYTCTASNKYGQDSSLLQIHRRGRNLTLNIHHHVCLQIPPYWLLWLLEV